MKKQFCAAILSASFCVVLTGCDKREQPTGQDAPAAAAEKIADLDTIVTPEIAAGIAGFAADAATKTYSPSQGNRDADVVRYSWENGRKKMIEGNEIPTRDKVEFGWVRKGDLVSIKGKATAPSFKDFMEPVEGIGEYAVWNSRDQQLIVLQSGREFSVWVNVSGDAAVNKAKSMELAQKIATGALK